MNIHDQISLASSESNCCIHIGGRCYWAEGQPSMCHPTCTYHLERKHGKTYLSILVLVSSLNWWWCFQWEGQSNGPAWRCWFPQAPQRRSNLLAIRVWLHNCGRRLLHSILESTKVGQDCHRNLGHWLYLPAQWRQLASQNPVTKADPSLYSIMFSCHSFKHESFPIDYSKAYLVVSCSHVNKILLLLSGRWIHFCTTKQKLILFKQTQTRGSTRPRDILTHGIWLIIMKGTFDLINRIICCRVRLI